MDDEKSRAKRTAGNEGRETLHQYVGGWNSNPITSDTPEDAERRGGSGTSKPRESTSDAGTGSKDTSDTKTSSGGSSTGSTSKTRADTR